MVVVQSACLTLGLRLGLPVFSIFAHAQSSPMQCSPMRRLHLTYERLQASCSTVSPRRRRRLAAARLDGISSQEADVHRIAEALEQHFGVIRDHLLPLRCFQRAHQCFDCDKHSGSGSHSQIIRFHCIPPFLESRCQPCLALFKAEETVPYQSITQKAHCVNELAYRDRID